MFKCLRITCAKYYLLRCMFFKKKSTCQCWCVLIESKWALFSVSSLKDEKLTKKQTYMKTKTCKLNSRDFWIFLPNIIKIDHYNSEMYRFKVGAFFETQCITVVAENIYWRHVGHRPRYRLSYHYRMTHTARVRFGTAGLATNYDNTVFTYLLLYCESLLCG